GPDLGLEPVHRFLRSIATFDRNQSIWGHCLVSQSFFDGLTLPSADASVLEAVLNSPEKRRPTTADSCAKLSKMAVKCPKGAVMPGQDQRPVYKFGAWEIDLARREMRLNGIPADVGSRAFEIVETLVQSADQLIDKYDLMNRVWPGAAVEE